MIQKFLKSLILFIFVLYGCALRSDKPYRIDMFGTDKFDETVIDFYYPDTVISPEDYQKMYYDLCYLEQVDLDKYFKLLEHNDFTACGELLDQLIHNSADKSFACLLKALMHLQFIKYSMGPRTRINYYDKQRYYDVFYLVQKARLDIDNKLINKLLAKIKPFIPPIPNEIFYEKIPPSEKANTLVEILRLKFDNKNLEKMSNQRIINYLSLTGIDSLDSKTLEGFHGFDRYGEAIFIRDL